MLEAILMKNQLQVFVLRGGGLLHILLLQFSILMPHAWVTPHPVIFEDKISNLHFRKLYILLNELTVDCRLINIDLKINIFGASVLRK